MKFLLRFPVAKEPRKEFKLNKGFHTKSVVTERTIAIQEAFGVGVDEDKTFPVFKDYVVNFDKDDPLNVKGGTLWRRLADQRIW